MPHWLTDNQKENSSEIGQELLTSANGHGHFLKNTVTEDETWIYGYEVETKMQSLQSVMKGSP